MHKFKITFTITITGNSKTKERKNLFYKSLLEALECFTDAIKDVWSNDYPIKIKIRSRKS